MLRLGFGAGTTQNHSKIDQGSISRGMEPGQAEETALCLNSPSNPIRKCHVEA